MLCTQTQYLILRDMNLAKYFLDRLVCAHPISSQKALRHRVRYARVTLFVQYKY